MDAIGSAVLTALSPLLSGAPERRDYRSIGILSACVIDAV